MRYFTVTGSRIAVSFSELERDILTGFFGQVRAILHERAVETGQSDAYTEHGEDDDVLSLLTSLEAQSRALPPPDDAAVARLLPSGRRDETPQAGESAVEFRRLTEHGLRSRKAATLATAIAALEAAEPPEVELDLDQARALAIGLTDARLILGERLGLRTDEDSERLHEELEAMLSGESDLDPAVAQKMAYYDFLSWVQESVTAAMLEG